MGQHRHIALAEHVARLRQDLLRGLGLRPAQEVALAELDAQVTHGLEVIGGLDAFGHHGGAHGLGDTHQCSHGLHLVGLVGHVAGEVLVDLDVVGLQLGPQAQAGAAVTEVVQRELHAVGAQGPDRVDQRRQVAHAFVFRQLDHHGRGRQPEAAQGGDAALQGFTAQDVHQGFGAEVDEELARRTQRGPGGHGGAQAGFFQCQRQALLLSLGEQRVRPLQDGVLRAAHQRLMPEQGAVAQADDGLEVHVEGPVGQDAGHAAMGWGRDG